MVTCRDRTIYSNWYTLVGAIGYILCHSLHLFGSHIAARAINFIRTADAWSILSLSYKGFTLWEVLYPGRSAGPICASDMKNFVLHSHL